jgi:hypothetical protein
MSPGSFLLALSTFEGAITMSTGFCESLPMHAMTTAIFDEMERALLLDS